MLDPVKDEFTDTAEHRQISNVRLSQPGQRCWNVLYRGHDAFLDSAPTGKCRSHCRLPRGCESVNPQKRAGWRLCRRGDLSPARSPPAVTPHRCRSRLRRTDATQLATPDLIAGPTVQSRASPPRSDTRPDWNASTRARGRAQIRSYRSQGRWV